jgi:hypothetical protein
MEATSILLSSGFQENDQKSLAGANMETNLLDQRDEKLKALCDELTNLAFIVKARYENLVVPISKDLPSKERNYLILVVRVNDCNSLEIRWTRYFSAYRQGVKKTAMPLSVKRGQKGTGFSSKILSKHAAPWAVDTVLETENQANQIRQLYKRVRKIQSQLRLLDVQTKKVVRDIDDFDLALAAAD